MPGEMSAPFRRAVQRFPDLRIIVAGDLMLDQYIRGSVTRLSPEAPVPVVQVSQDSLLPGGAGNVAVNLASLGANVEVLGVIGEDEAGSRLRLEFAAQGIEAGRVYSDRSRVTSQKCRVIAERQQVIRYDRESSGPLDSPIEDALLKSLARAAIDADAVILSDYGKGVITPSLLKAAIGLCRGRKIPITVDPKVEHFQLYRGVTCITPNVSEAFAGMRQSVKSGVEPLTDLGRAILSKLRCASLLITRGPDGMSLFARNGSVKHIPTRAREVFDVTGAGDTVIAALTLGLAAGLGPSDAASLANCAAGIVVGKLGTASASPKELLDALKQR